MVTVFSAIGALLVAGAFFYWQKAQQARELSQLGRYVTHEINSLLYAGRTSAELLVRLVEQNADKEKKITAARNILTSTDVIFETVAVFKEMLSATVVPAPEKSDLRALIDTVLISFDGICQSSQITLEKEIGSILLVAVSGPHFKFIVRNLMKNAVQAVIVDQRRKEAKKICIRLFAEQQKKRAILEIVDNGVGMDARVKRYCTRFGFSTYDHLRGFGLSMVRSALKKQQMQMQIESQKGCGSTFRIFIPIR